MGGNGAHRAEQSAVGEQGRSQGHGQGRRKDTSVGGAGKDAGDRGRDPPHGPEGKEAGVRPSQGSGAGRGPKSEGRKGDVGPQGQVGRGAGAAGGGQSVGRGTGSGVPPQPDVQPVRCIPPGIQQMPAHHAHHHHHHHAHLYNIDTDVGDLVPPKSPRPHHQPPPSPPHGGALRGPAPAAPEPRSEPAQMAAAPSARGHGAAPAPQAQGPQAKPARGAEGARDWDRDLDANPDLLGGEALPLVVEVYGRLSWCSSGTTRGMRNRPFDAVLLGRDGEKQEVPPGRWAAQEDHERVLRAVIWAGWPDMEPK